MQTLAQDVGGLKRVLSNVKTRGNIGEIQLSMLLEQLLAPEQYEANVHTRKGSDAVVEFAVKLPGRDDAREFVYLPIDAKFPKDVYEQLLDAYDAADSQAIEAAGKLLETTIKKMAKDISDKYLALPPRPISALCSCRSRAFTPRSYAVPLYWRTCNETTR